MWSLVAIGVAAVLSYHFGWGGSWNSCTGLSLEVAVGLLPPPYTGIPDLALWFSDLTG